jgi:hypothetical protein
MQIEAQGGQITVTVNEVMTARLENDSRVEDYIALQHAGKNVVELRNLRIE